MIFTLLLAFSLFMLYVSWGNLKKVEFAKSVLEDIHKLYMAGIISEIQAKVFMNDMQNPYDIASIIGVKRELDRIVEAHVRAQNTNR